MVHVNVTEHPTAHWTAQTVVKAFPNDTAPSYLLRDRDRVYGEQFRIRRECLDHVLVLSERHLRHILTRYFDYYHGARIHLSLEKDAPEVRPIHRPKGARSWRFPRSEACAIDTSGARHSQPHPVGLTPSTHYTCLLLTQHTPPCVELHPFRGARVARGCP